MSNQSFKLPTQSAQNAPTIQPEKAPIHERIQNRIDSSVQSLKEDIELLKKRIDEMEISCNQKHEEHQGKFKKLSIILDELQNKIEKI